MSLIGEKVRSIRLKKRLTLKEVAMRAKISIGFLADIESGRTNPSINTLNKLAEALRVTPNDLLIDYKYTNQKKNPLMVRESRVAYNTGTATSIDDEATRLFARLSNLTPEGREKVLRELEWIEELERKRFLEKRKKQNQEKN